ncbi:hypothetical protein AB5I41_04305 [Sphingomonas sp. MMS24-JH45]
MLTHANWSRQRQRPCRAGRDPRPTCRRTTTGARCAFGIAISNGLGGSTDPVEGFIYGEGKPATELTGRHPTTSAR